MTAICVQALGADDTTDEAEARMQLALLHRVLHRAGFDDDLGAGHISYRLDSESFLVTPDAFGWDEVSASSLARLSIGGSEDENHPSVSSAARVLHRVIHERRPDIRVAVHNHPRWSTVWAAAGRLPPIYDQFGMFATDDLVLSARYETGVSLREEACAQVESMEGATTAILQSHGVLVMASSVRQAHLKCAALEHRARMAWHVTALGGAFPVESGVAAGIAAMVDTEAARPHHFEYAIRRELRTDPGVLE